MKDYIGRCPHDGVVSWMAGDVEPKEVRAYVSSLLKKGLTIDRMEREEAKATLKGCIQCAALRAARKPKGGK